MKKFLYTSLVALAGFFAVSCQQEHIEVVYDPAAVTVQTLGEIADVVLDKDGEKIVTTFAPADFKLTVATTYQLNASASSDMADKVKVSASIDIDEKGLGTISIKQADLNALVYALGGAAEEPMTIYFQLSASVATDKKAAIGATTKESNIISAVFTPYATVVKDVTLYDHVWVIGSSASVGSWSFEKVYQYLYDYEKKGETFTGLIDFGEAGPSGGFKLTGAGNWDDATLNWGSEAQAEEAEAESIALLADGGSKDIKCYSHRYYFFSLDRASLVLTKKYSFDNVGIVGAFNGWAADDANMKMTYNDQFHRFYIDQTFAEDTELKFTCDDKWDLNWGGEDGKTAGNGANIKVAAGSYRIYLDLNYGEYSLDASMFGKDEPTGEEETPEEPKPEVWSLIGTLSGTGWDKDFDMANISGDTWIIRSVTVTADDEFKIRPDHDWPGSVGGPEENSTSTIDASNPYGVYKPVIGTAFEAGEKNIQIGEAGTFDVTFDYAANTILIEKHVAVYSLIGNINGDSWKVDVPMTEKDGVWTSPVVTINGGFKIRYDYSWDDANTYGLASGEETKLGEKMTLTQPGSDMKVENGNYKVQFTPETKEVIITAVLYPEQLYMTGTDFGNWGWGEGTVEMTPVLHNPDWGANAEAQFWTVRYLTAGNGVKFNSALGWDGNQFGSLETNEGFTNDGDGNLQVAESGIYMIHIDFKRSILHVEPARISLVGDCTDMGDDAWNEEKVEAVEANIFKADGKELKITLPKGGNLRMYAASAISTSPAWTREFNIYDGVIEYRGTGGDLAEVSVKKGQVVTLDPNAGTGSIEGEGEGPSYMAELSVPGNWSVWTADAPKLSGDKKGNFAGPLVMAGDAIEFKFIHDGAWIGGKAGEEDLSYELGASDNMTIAAGTYWWTVDLVNNTAKALPVTQVGLIGSFNEWSTDVVLTAGADDTYTGSVTLEDNAKFKVRFNGSWDYCLGGSVDAFSAFGGDIVVAEGGTYTVTVYLNHGKITLSK